MSIILQGQIVTVRPDTGWQAGGIIIHGSRIVFGTRNDIPQSLQNKLQPQNNTGLGSTAVRGTVLNTQDAARTILSVANAYLVNKLTADEMAWILSHRDKFTFSIGVGDRRGGVEGRFAIATNWHGEDVTRLQLRPNPSGAPEYDFRLTFSASAGTLTLTDNHVFTPNTYGGLRYFIIRKT